MRSIFLVLALAASMQALPHLHQQPSTHGLRSLVPFTLKGECPEDTEECDKGCCPNEGWYCCSDGLNCAGTQEECPHFKGSFVNQRLQVAGPLVSFSDNRKGECAEGQVACPNGCCKFPGWVCCDDGKNCAVTPRDCPKKKAKKTVDQLISFAVMNKGECADGQVACPNGCCKFPGWVCCDDGKNCAVTPRDCPKKKVKRTVDQLISFAVMKKGECADGQVACPNGCCKFPGWVCCDDGKNCAVTPRDCPKKVKKNVEHLIFFAFMEKGECADGQVACPNGCCKFPGWVCCDDGKNCAVTPRDCLDKKQVDYFTVMEGRSTLDERYECTECPGGCCGTVPGLVCCPDGNNCATELSACP